MFGYGLIGCGAFGRFCLEHYAALDDIVAVAAADVDPTAVRVAADRFGLAACASIDELLSRDDVDVVHIATSSLPRFEVNAIHFPSGLHWGWVSLCLPEVNCLERPPFVAIKYRWERYLFSLASTFLTAKTAWAPSGDREGALGRASSIRSSADNRRRLAIMFLRLRCRVAFQHIRNDVRQAVHGLWFRFCSK